MKQVRYALGLAGAAPALGMLMPAAPATHTSGVPAHVHAGCRGKETASMHAFGSWAIRYTPGARRTCVAAVADNGIYQVSHSPSSPYYPVPVYAERVRIMSGHGATLYSKTVPTPYAVSSNSGNFKHTWYVHCRFPNQVTVCGSSDFSTGTGGWHGVCQAL